MNHKLVLSYKANGIETFDSVILELDLFSQIPSMSEIDYSKCKRVYEDGKYSIKVCLAASELEVSSDDIKNVEVFVNGNMVGNAYLEANEDFLEGTVSYRDSIFEKPFLLLYDFIKISIKVICFGHSIDLEFHTDYLLCLSTNQPDVENINNIVKELSLYNNPQIGEWIFSEVQKEAKMTGLMRGDWLPYAYRSLSSFVQMLEDIASCYKENYNYLKSMGKHTIESEYILKSYDKVNKVTFTSFQWIMHNADYLSKTTGKNGIAYNRDYYLPIKIKAEIKNKSWDTYENRCIVGFLYTVLSKSMGVTKEFSDSLKIEDIKLARVLNTARPQYVAPIITLKRCQIKLNKDLLSRLNHINATLQFLYMQYTQFLGIEGSYLNRVPQKLKTFQEVKPYTQIFERILIWFNYGEYDLAKEKLLLQVKTLDKLFEYFCLFRLLSIFQNHGYILTHSNNHLYQVNNVYDIDMEVANTYILQKDEMTLTLYYQPVISSLNFYNGLALYRTTVEKRNGKKESYFTPDFVLKFAYGDMEEYVLLDAKFSNRTSIQSLHLDDLIYKYGNQIAVNAQLKTPVMVWALQGRTDESYDTYRMHNSSLAQIYKPIPSYGIAKFNTLNKPDRYFWKELLQDVSILSKAELQHNNIAI